MMLVSFPLAFLVIRTIKETNYDDEKPIHVEDLKDGRLEDGGGPETSSVEKAGEKGETGVVA